MGHTPTAFASTPNTLNMSTVHVKGISSQTSEKEIRDFFSFCGKIQSLSVTPESSDANSTQSASVTFEKETAAKTALLLDNTQLGPAQVSVSSAKSLNEAAGGKTAGSYDEKGEDGEIAQEDGYALSDNAVQRAIQMDQQHGVSNRFMKALTDFDSKYKASEKTKAMDEKYGVSARAGAGWRGITSYFERASNTPTGQRIRAFYDQGQKQVMDVHNEARHLADLKSGKSADQMGMHQEGDRTKCNCGGATGSCPCAPGTCGCANCSKNPDEKTTDVTAEQAEMEKVTKGDGKEGTKCNCGGADGKCPCPPGQCTCSGCSKAS